MQTQSPCCVGAMMQLCNGAIEFLLVQWCNCVTTSAMLSILGERYTAGRKHIIARHFPSATRERKLALPYLEIIHV